MRFGNEVRNFIIFTSTKPGEVWHLRHLWSTADGWRVEWRCLDRTLILDPTDARKLARYLINQFCNTFRKAPPEKRQPEKEAEILAWVNALDTKGKEALHNNRENMTPPLSEQVPA